MTLYYLEAQMQLRRHMIFIQNLGDDKNIFASHRSFCRITHEIQTLNLSLDWWSIVLRPVREHVTYVYNCEWFTQKRSWLELGRSFVVKQVLGFWGQIQRTAQSSYLYRHAKGYWGIKDSILFRYFMQSSRKIMRISHDMINMCVLLKSRKKPLICVI